MQDARRRTEGELREKHVCPRAEADYEVQGDRKCRGKDRENTTDTRGESKVMLQDITWEVQGRELHGKEDLELNTDLIDTMELENSILSGYTGLEK